MGSMHSGCLVGNFFAKDLEQKDRAEELEAIKMGPICIEEHFGCLLVSQGLLQSLGILRFMRTITVVCRVI